MKKRFQITITEQAVETKICGKDWKEGAGDPDDAGSAYGYTPEIEKQIEVTREIYKQDVETLDLASVIVAVNGLATNG